MRAFRPRASPTIGPAGAASVATTRGTCEQVLHNTEAVQQAESLLRADARAALDHARAVLEDAVAEVDTHTYQRWLLVKGAAQASIGDTEDGARIMREVKGWAEEHDEKALLAPSHRRLSALFRRVGDPALMLEHAVAAVELLDPDADARRARRPPDRAGRRARRERFLRRLDPSLPGGRRSSPTACGDRYLQLAVLNNLAYTQYEAGLAGEAVATVEQLQPSTPRRAWRSARTRRHDRARLQHGRPVRGGRGGPRAADRASPTSARTATGSSWRC